MRRSGGFPKPQMTNKANRLAFTMWLNGASDAALASANPESLARSYGVSVADVEAEIRHQKNLRRVSA